MKQAQPEPGASSSPPSQGTGHLLAKAASRVLSEIQRAALEVSVRLFASSE